VHPVIYLNKSMLEAAKARLAKHPHVGSQERENGGPVAEEWIQPTAVRKADKNEDVRNAIFISDQSQVQSCDQPTRKGALSDHRARTNQSHAAHAE